MMWSQMRTPMASWNAKTWDDTVTSDFVFFLAATKPVSFHRHAWMYCSSFLACQRLTFIGPNLHLVLSIASCEKCPNLKKTFRILVFHGK